jgi:hypothetical protein
VQTLNIVIVSVVHVDTVCDSVFSKIELDLLTKVGVVPLSNFLFGFAPVQLPLRETRRCLELEWRLLEAVVFNPSCRIYELYLSSNQSVAFALRVNVVTTWRSITLISILKSLFFVDVESAELDSVVLSTEVSCQLREFTCKIGVVDIRIYQSEELSPS